MIDRNREYLRRWLTFVDTTLELEDTENYIKFINWHSKNNWGLKFYIYKDKKDLDDLIFRNINDDEPLTDFLIKDSMLVYGRKDEKQNIVFLKLIHTIDGKIDKQATIESYENLFISLWDDSLTLAQAQEEIFRENLIKQKGDEIKKEYSSEFSQISNGVDYLSAVCKKISNASKSIKAVDIAETKESGLVGWSIMSEYDSFLTSTINAKVNGSEVKRIYAVNNYSSLKDNYVKNIMLKQLENDICLGFVLIKDCQENSFSPDDFIILDEKFCFYLGKKEFRADELNYLETLIPRSLIPNYIRDFDNLWDFNKTNKFLGSSSIEEFNNFFNHL
jgi:hypothetical protein